MTDSKTDAQKERDQVRKAREAMRVELEQTNSRADEVLERLRKKVAAKAPVLRVVKAQ